MGLTLHHLYIGSFLWFIVCVFTANVDHDLFLKQIHLQELGIQIQHMHEKLYEHCPNDFQTPNSASIIGRRRSVDTSLDLKIELAEKTLDYLILKFGNCTDTTTVITLQTTTEKSKPTTTTGRTIHPTTTPVRGTTTYHFHTTTQQCKLIKRLLIVASENVDCLAFFLFI